MMKCTILSFAILFAATVDAGTDKTETPTIVVDRPTLSPSNPPITEFPTEGTPQPTPSPTDEPVSFAQLSYMHRNLSPHMI